ncbi:hypothetical protein [Legionella sp. CNM-4043-24]|uniref:hypothetical protein n=1 Tax=Legionella sp. CNM-4043-24 TaxID=3421646 RepID=UPI00403B2037
MNLKKSLVAISAVSLLGLSGSLFASNPTSGQLIVINSVGVVVNGSAGSSASSVKVVVNDATGPCSTTPILAIGGVVTVKWDSTKTHSTTQCTDITSVDVTALKTSAGVVQYDSTANTTPPAVATAATTFTAPTTPISNLALMVTGNASAAMTNSATSWGSALGVAPIYLTTNGALSTTGIMGAVGMAGLKAESYMHRYAVMPAGMTPYAYQ